MEERYIIGAKYLGMTKPKTLLESIANSPPDIANAAVLAWSDSGEKAHATELRAAAFGPAHATFERSTALKMSDPTSDPGLRNPAGYDVHTAVCKEMAKTLGGTTSWTTPRGASILQQIAHDPKTVAAAAKVAYQKFYSPCSPEELKIVGLSAFAEAASERDRGRPGTGPAR